MARALIETAKSSLPSLLNSQELDAEMQRMGFSVELTNKLGRNLYRKGTLSVFVTSHELYYTDFTSKFVTINTFQDGKPVMDWVSESQITLTWEGARKAIGNK